MYNNVMDKVKFLFNQTCYVPGGRVQAGDIKELPKSVAKEYEKNRWGNIYKPRGKKNESSSNKKS
tara:strand:- start:320 stop:514 length:195 start_codon:yes stop_codon:yes gene_type:complete